MARYDLALSSREFWSMTPAQFFALLRRREADLLRHDLRAGIISSLIANANRDPKKRSRPYTPEDFMPKKSQKIVKEEDPAVIKQKWDIIVAQLNARARRQNG